MRGHQATIDDAIAGRIAGTVDYRVNAEKALDGALHNYPDLAGAYFAFIKELRGGDDGAR